MERYVVIAETKGKELHLEEIIEDYAERHYIIPLFCYACDRLNELERKGGEGFCKRCIKKVIQAIYGYTNQELPIVLRLEANHDPERLELVKKALQEKQCAVCGKMCGFTKCGRCIMNEMLGENFELPDIYKIDIQDDCEQVRLLLEKMP